jgi:hypothetical protein
VAVRRLSPAFGKMEKTRDSSAIAVPLQRFALRCVQRHHCCVVAGDVPAIRRRQGASPSTLQPYWLGCRRHLSMTARSDGHGRVCWALRPLDHAPGDWRCASTSDVPRTVAGHISFAAAARLRPRPAAPATGAGGLPLMRFGPLQRSLVVSRCDRLPRSATIPLRRLAPLRFFADGCRSRHPSVKARARFLAASPSGDLLAAAVPAGHSSTLVVWRDVPDLFG